MIQLSNLLGNNIKLLFSFICLIFQEVDHNCIMHNFNKERFNCFFRSDAIYSALYDGTGMIEIIRGHEYLSHPFAVSLFGSEVYWTDWRTNTLSKANKWTGQNVSVIQKTSAQPFDLQIYHPSRQPQGKVIILIKMLIAAFVFIFNLTVK